jgi:hypothetical protein
MKKLFTLFLIALSIQMLGKNANAQLLLYDDFTGLDSANLAGQSSWIKGGSGPDPVVREANPLVYTDYNGGGADYVLMPTASATTSRVYKGFTSTAPGTNTFFYTALINLSSASASSVGYFMSLGDPTTGTTYFARLFARTSGTGYNLGISKLSNTAAYGSTVFDFNTTYLVVVRYTFVTGSANDSVAVWVNPPLGAEPPTAVTAEADTVAIADATPANVGNFHWHNRGLTNPVGKFDGIRVAYGSSSEAAWTNLNAVLPVELSSFTSNVNKTNVTLNWTTVMEENNSGFDVERKYGSGEWTKLGNVHGNGSSNLSHSYSFEDKNLSTGNYSYRLKQIDYNGNFEYFNLSGEVIIGVPAKFDVGQNYPNPFNPSTSINYQLPAADYVSLKIYDMTGREVMQLVNEVKQAGYYTVKFDASKLTSGMYFYKIQSGEFSSIKKMMLVK